MMRKVGMVAVALLASGCMDHRPTPLPGPRECRAGMVQSFVGRQMTPRVQSRLRQRSRADTVRVVRPGEAVTMDFRRDRLTVDIDRRGVIRSLRCG
ncbi:I78 family peptidase inhibitor [Sphingomonas sp. DT-204]|uniref:I78 family peptidase inhibitor n=1 Tax=Sphingomonas sp. DT-204 TaxID=3396166 RepID=UPI003F1AEA5A